MKKLFFMLLAVVLLLSFSACQKGNSAEEEEAELDAVSDSVSGTLKSYTGSEISIKTEDGETLSFDNCSRAELDLKNGIIPGNEVMLVYVGAIDGADTSKVRIRKIITSDDNSGVLGLAKKAQGSLQVNGSAVSDTNAGEDLPASGADVEKTNGTGYITGGVNVRNDAASGSDIIGSLSGGDAVTVTGICDNGWYRIIYEGKTGYVWQDFISY